MRRRSPRHWRSSLPIIRRLAELPFRAARQDRGDLLILRLAWSRANPIEACFTPASPNVIDYPLITSPTPKRVALERLACSALLKRRHFMRTHTCDRCESHRLLAFEACRACGGADLADEAIIHHYRCGCQQGESGFVHGMALVCPKCRRDLRHIGVDYGKPGLIVRCRNCGACSAEPEPRFACLDCTAVIGGQQAASVDWFHYDLTDAGMLACEPGDCRTFPPATRPNGAPAPRSMRDFQLLATAALRSARKFARPFTLARLTPTNLAALRSRYGAAPLDDTVQQASCRHRTGIVGQRIRHRGRWYGADRIPGDRGVGCFIAGDGCLRGSGGPLGHEDRFRRDAARERCRSRISRSALIRDAGVAVPRFARHIEHDSLLWYMLVLEVPRYCLGAIVIGFAGHRRPLPLTLHVNPTISLLLVGHNEATALRPCVLALAEQSVMLNRSQVQIVVVDDGSTDSMLRIARDLRAAGLVDDLLHVAMRGGKSAAVNLGLTMCRGEIVVILDIDTTLDRDALERLLPYFADPRVGGVGGDLGVRNARREPGHALPADRISHRDLSGPADRRSAGPVDDRLRRVRRVPSQRGPGGWRAGRRGRRGCRPDDEAAPRRLAHPLRTRCTRPDPRAGNHRGTDLTAAALGPWPRDNLAPKIPRHTQPVPGQLPSARRGAVLDVLLFQLVAALVFPVYVLWLWSNLGAFGFSVLAATLTGYILLDLLAFSVAASLAAEPLRAVRLLVWLPFYIVVQVGLLRPVRLIEITQELLLRSSYRDQYVPTRVMRQVERV